MISRPKEQMKIDITHVSNFFPFLGSLNIFKIFPTLRPKKLPDTEGGIGMRYGHPIT